MKDQEVNIYTNKDYLEIGPWQLRVENLTKGSEVKASHLQISAVGLSLWSQQSKKDDKIQIFAASLADINKALQKKIPTDPRTKLPPQYQEFLALFDKDEANKLPPHRLGVDYEILLEEVDGKEAKLP